MDDRLFRDREKAMEESYFRQQDAKLLQTLRQKADLDDIAAALADQLSVSRPDLLIKVRSLGITPDTAAALLVAPLVQVAWAEGHVSKPEREVVFRLAAERGVAKGSPAHDQLVDWLGTRPSDDLFDTAVEVLKCGLDVLPPSEKAERVSGITAACRAVAEASGSEVARLLGLGDGVSRDEDSVLDAINKHLRVGE